MRFLMTAAIAMLIAAPAAAQRNPQEIRPVEIPSDGKYHVEAPRISDINGNSDFAAFNAGQRDQAPLRYRLFDWDRPDPALGNYSPETYYNGWSTQQALTPKRRIYRGEHGLYFCRHDDGGTGLVWDGQDGRLLYGALPKGGTALLRDLPGEALAAAVARGEIRCN